jgi:hypothetical protein
MSNSQKSDSNPISDISSVTSDIAKPKSNKNMIIILVIAFLVLLGIGGAVLWYYKFRKVDCIGKYEDSWSVCDPVTNKRTKKFKVEVEAKNGGSCSPDLTENCGVKLMSVINKTIPGNPILRNYKNLPDSTSKYMISYTKPDTGGVLYLADIDLDNEEVTERTVSKDLNTSLPTLNINAKCDNGGALSNLWLEPITNKYYYNCTSPEQLGTIIPNDNTVLTEKQTSLNKAIRVGNISCDNGEVLLSYKPEYNASDKTYQIRYQCGKPEKTIKLQKDKDTGVQFNWNDDAKSNVVWYNRNNWNCDSNFGALSKITPQVYKNSNDTLGDNYPYTALDSSGKPVGFNRTKSTPNNEVYDNEGRGGTSRQTYLCNYT